jgi:hypothetical protein
MRGYWRDEQFRRIEPWELESEAQRVRTAWAEFIMARSWDAFSTQTYKTPRHDGYYAARSYFDAVSNVAHVSRAFIAVEPNRLQGLHLHCLLAYDTQVSATPAREHMEGILFRSVVATETKWAGFNRVEAPKNSMDVARYVSKYVTKADAGEFYIMGDKQWWEI